MRTPTASALVLVLVAAATAAMTTSASGCAVGEVTHDDPGRGDPQAARAHGVYVPIRGYAGASKTMFVPGGAPLPIYLNRGGGTFQAGADDARANTSSVIASTGHATVKIPAFAADEATWSAVVGCVADQLDRFNVRITVQEPTDGPYLEVVIGGAGSEMGLGGYAGVAPIDTGSCRLIDRAVVFVFSDNLADARGACEAAAATIGNVASLDHAFACEDPMSYLSGCGDRRFQDAELACGELEERPCICGRSGQNSVQILLERFGPANAAPPPAPAPGECGELDYTGTCSDRGLLSWCEDGHARTLDCAAYAMDCGFVDDELGKDCKRRKAPDACMGIDFLGECSPEGVLTYCADGALFTVDCAASGNACAFVDETIGYNCVVPPVVDACMGIDFFGQCSEDATVLTYCQGGELVTIDCASLGQICAFQDDFVGFDCLTP